ncbi:MAG TPA: PIG-L deacetylase family protein [Rhizomicrobium sp.]
MSASPREFLEAIRDEGRPAIDGSKVAVAVAHPDDETIGCGALLSRLAGVSVVVVTDGAPADGADARAHGFADRESYAWRRAAELDQAMQIAGVSRDNVIRFGVADQQAAFGLEKITARLAQLFAERGIGVVLTHAYEGGHPDHDATAFCAHRAVNRLNRAIAILEMPYYRLGATGDEFQTFPPGAATLRIPLDEQERTRKQRMLGAYATQTAVLANFTLASEQFRMAPDHDFSVLPNGGRVLYEQRGWGLTGGEWLRCVRKAVA